MNPIENIRIATRSSPLALWQAEHVKQLIEQVAPQINCILVPMKTSGDRFTQDSLSVIGGKGAFVKELEHALINNQADIAVHSMKDVPVQLPDPLMIGAYLQRDDPRDSFISKAFDSLAALPPGATIGTASLRRSAIIKHFRHDLQVVLLRGNIQTRLTQLDQQKYDAIILAAAGLKRLNLENTIKTYLPIDQFIPAITQGILGIECHKNNGTIIELLRQINHIPTEKIAETERVFNRVLGGSCHVPVAGFAHIVGRQLHLIGLVADLEGKRYIRGAQSGSIEQHQEIGIALAESLLAQGADQILSVYIQSHST